jgi:membrane protein
VADYVAHATGLGPIFAWTWKTLQWPVILVLVALGAAIVYYFAPDAEQEWVWVTPGSVLTTVLWLLASLGFKYYVTNFGSYTETYGAIGGVMVLLLWFYISGLVAILGAELNAEIEHASPYGKAAGEKVPGQRRAIGALAYSRYRARPPKPVAPRVRPAPPPPEPDPGTLPRAAAAAIAAILVFRSRPPARR